MRSSGHFDYSGLPHILPTDVNGEYFAKGTEKIKILAGLMDKFVENLDDQGCPKVQDLVDEEMWVCSSYPFRHKTTLHCAKCKAQLFANWIRDHIDL